MSIKGRCFGGGNFSKFSNYINIKGEYPKVLSFIRWDNMVLNKEELNDNNWLYIGSESEETKRAVLRMVKNDQGYIYIM